MRSDQRSCFSMMVVATGLVLLLGARSDAATYLVRPDGTGDYPTIQAAINAASNGDVIELASGTFTGTGNRNVGFGGKAVTVRSQAGDPEQCIVDCQSAARGFRFESGEPSEAVLEGVTVRNGLAQHGGAIYVNSSSPTIRGVRMFGNVATGEYGGGAIFLDSGSQPEVVNCVIRGNTSSFGGAGILIREGNVNAVIRGCTIVQNHSSGGVGGIGILYNATALLERNIVALNTGAIGGVYAVHGYANLTLACNDIWNNNGSALDDFSGLPDPTGDDGNISADPLFCGVAAGDFRIDPTSPCAPVVPLGTGCDLIGALPVGCSGTPPPPPTVACFHDFATDPSASTFTDPVSYLHGYFPVQSRAVEDGDGMAFDMTVESCSVLGNFGAESAIGFTTQNGTYFMGVLLVYDDLVCYRVRFFANGIQGTNVTLNEGTTYHYAFEYSAGMLTLSITDEDNVVVHTDARPHSPGTGDVFQFGVDYPGGGTERFEWNEENERVEFRVDRQFHPSHIEGWIDNVRTPGCEFGPLTITPPDSVFAENDPGICGRALANIVLGTPVPNDDRPDVEFNNDAPDVIPVGETIVTWTAADGFGNSDTTTQIVTIIDTTPPTISAPPAVEVVGALGPSGCAAYIDDATLGEASADDNCAGVTITRNGVPASNSFPVGTTEIVHAATDAAGSIATASQWVAVLEPAGSISGSVSAACPEPESPLLGVRVDAYDSTGTLVGTDVTGPDGVFEIGPLASGMPLTISPVVPLGYQVVIDEISSLLACGDAADVNFAFTCDPIAYNPRTIGFWKHQVGVATGGPGSAQVAGSTLCAHLDLIEVHFNDNSINSVQVYEPPASGTCGDKLEVARTLLNLKGSVAMVARARQQLMALLFNVAAGYVSLTEVVSVDGATLSQAITYCDHLIDGASTGHELAKTIADRINNGQLVGVGMIPLDTEDIAYKAAAAVNPVFLGLNRPNPFRGTTAIEFRAPASTPYSLSIFNAAGQRIRSYSGAGTANLISLVWDGVDDVGARVAAGAYFYELRVGDLVKSRRMTLVR